MNHCFRDRTALVLGSTSGIGEGIARLFARCGANVILAGRSVEAGQAIAREIQEAGQKANFVRCDIEKEEDVAALVDAAVETYGQLDYAANCAGMNSIPMPVHKLASDHFDQVLAINLRGIFLAMKYELLHMVSRKRGTIVNIASTAGHVAFAGFAPYVASKHGLVGLTRAAALDYAGDNIRVNGVSPGPVDTPLLRQGLANLGQSMESKIQSNPMGRAGSVDEIADAVLWLCSDRASFVTGQFINADGGYTLR